MRLTVAQCRAGRALLDWSMSDLATAAEVGVMTVNRFEGGQNVASSSLDKIAAALERAGIVFISPGEQSTQGGAGVRLADGAG